MDKDGPRSNPYKPNPEKCCEACIFGSGKPAEWCPEHVVLVDQYGDKYVLSGWDDPRFNDLLLRQGCWYTSGTRLASERRIAELQSQLDDLSGPADCGDISIVKHA